MSVYALGLSDHWRGISRRLVTSDQPATRVVDRCLRPSARATCNDTNRMIGRREHHMREVGLNTKQLLRKLHMGTLWIRCCVFVPLCILILGSNVRCDEARPGSAAALFGPNVYVFNPKSPKMQEVMTNIYATQMKHSSEFTEKRYALLFQPGLYNLDVRVGYYTQVAGLGMSPDDVTITGAVRTQDDPASKPPWEAPGALNNFWRSAENLSVVPTLGSLTFKRSPLRNYNVWAVSQGAPLRRIHIKPSSVVLSEAECRKQRGYIPNQGSPLGPCPTTLRLSDEGWSSGGFMADSRIDGLVGSGSQQQWFARNSAWTQWDGGVWNMVFLGSSPVPSGVWPARAVTDAGKTPLIREKPFLSVDKDGQFFVVVPGFKKDAVGVDWDGKPPPQAKIPIESFYIVKSEKQEAQSLDAATINSALRAGKNLLFAPGVYLVNGTIEVTRPDTVILGLGYADLVANNGQPAMTVADVGGVTIGGIIFEAGPSTSTTLLQVGEAGSSKDHSDNPSMLYDIFCRVGGSRHIGKATSCVTINSSNVTGDNLWLWRADHGGNVGWNDNPADTGLIVNGSHVSMYGLAVEHFQKYQTIWNGDFGRVYFYQSEMPYDPPNQAAWTNASNAHSEGYASYKVGDKVTQHQALGVGVYCYFRDSPITAYHAIEVPPAVEPGFKNLVIFFLNGRVGSKIVHIINDDGSTVTMDKRKATLPE